MNNIILLASGGIDSFVAHRYLGRPKVVYFDLKSRYSQKELEVVNRLFHRDLIVDASLDLSDREIGEKAYIPFRNLLLAAQAVKYGDIIIMGGLKDDVVSDKNKDIFGKMSSILSEMENRQIVVYSPFWNMTKAEVVAWYIKTYPTKKEVNLLLSTTSCYHPTEHYCGQCPSCFRKWCALGDNDIMLPFHNDDLLKSYYEAARTNKYIPERNESIIRRVDAHYSRY